MKLAVVTVSLLVVYASASGHSDPRLLFKKQSSCPSTEQICGDGCIPTSYTCCPDGSGGCPPTEYCGLADNGVYGCCPNGETCTGSATATTDTINDSSTYYSTATSSALASATATSGSGVCQTDWKTCGDGCIPQSWTCCADGSGGCDPLVAKCYLGSDGRYGCCQNIYSTCSGPAGNPTTIPSDFSETTTPMSTTSPTFAFTTSSHRITSTAAISSATAFSTDTAESSVTAVGTRSISSHSTAAQTSISIQSASSEAYSVANENPLAALFSAIIAAATFLIR